MLLCDSLEEEGRELLKVDEKYLEKRLVDSMGQLSHLSLRQTEEG